MLVRSGCAQVGSEQVDLSRPQPKRDAETLLTQRTRTLERIGYTVIHSSEAEREPWAWLQDLVHRQLQRTDDPKPTVAEAEAKRQREEIADAIAVVDARVKAALRMSAEARRPTSGLFGEETKPDSLGSARACPYCSTAFLDDPKKCIDCGGERPGIGWPPPSPSPASAVLRRACWAAVSWLKPTL